jgi:uncharacterized membrane protein YvbJ
VSQSCPECGADQPIDAMRCGVCGARMVPQETPASRVTGQDIFDYSCYTIALILIAMAVPCLVGLVCIMLSR